MITSEIAAREVSRLDATENYHWKTEDAVKELIGCLMRNAADEGEAQRAVSAWLVGQRECPTVADLIAAIAEVREEAGPGRDDHGCLLCRGTGKVGVYQFCTRIGDSVLAQDLPGGWWEAQALRDKWTFEKLAWMKANPYKKGVYYKPEQSQFIGEIARPCPCGLVLARRKQ